jgi:hypothetical protein
MFESGCCGQLGELALPFKDLQVGLLRPQWSEIEIKSRLKPTNLSKVFDPI